MITPDNCVMLSIIRRNNVSIFVMQVFHQSIINASLATESIRF